MLAVYTQPDRPKGRGQKDSMPPVKEAALRLGLPVHQPARVRAPEVVEQLRGFAPDIMVVVGYGQIIPQAILDIPPLGIINVHASLLPKYRGAAPIQWAIARGETVTGVTTMRINAGLDTGDMLLKKEVEIGPEETADQVSLRLAPIGAELLVETLSRIDTIVPQQQDEALATYAPILKKEDGLIDWHLSAGNILNRIRGFQPWPGGYTFLRGVRIHLWKAQASTAVIPAGEMKVENQRLFAGSGQGSIEILEVQMEGRKRMPVKAFLNGFTVASGEVFA